MFPVGDKIRRLAACIKNRLRPPSGLSRDLTAYYSKPLRKNGIIARDDVVTEVRPVFSCKLSEENSECIETVRSLIGRSLLSEMPVPPDDDCRHQDDFISWQVFSTIDNVCGLIECISYYELYCHDQLEFKRFISREDFESVRPDSPGQ